jgi:hypothetical protein
LPVARRSGSGDFLFIVRVIDSHVHLYPPEANQDPALWATTRRENDWSAMCTRRRRNGAAVQGFPSLDELIHEMDDAGVETAILLGWYWKHHDTCAAQNRFYADCVRTHPDRLAAFATLQPDAGRDVTLSEIRRARDDGLIGLGELSPHSQGYTIGDPVFREILTLASELHWPVNLHVTDPNCRDYPGRVETPLEDFMRLARAWPNVRFILAHWGGLLPLRDPDAVELTNIFYDTAASPLIYDESVWARMLSALPPERVLFGSDFPLNVYPKLDATPKMSRLIAEARASQVPSAVLRDNAAGLLPKATT